MVSFVLHHALQYVLISAGMHIAIFVVAWLVITRAGLKDRQTRQLPRAPRPEGPQGSDSKAKFYWY